MGFNSAVKFSVVIPAYNEEAAIENTLRSCIEHLSSLDSGDYEIIMVDDGSTDATSAKAANFKEVKVLSLPRNLGYGAAVKSGVRAAKFDWILILDGDGQHNAESLAGFLDSVREGYDMVIGARQEGSHKSWVREPGKKLLGIVANFLSDEKIPDLNSGMRIFKKSIFYRYEPLYPNGFSISTTLTLAFIGDGYSVKFIPITTRRRVGRHSNVRIMRDGFNTLIMILRTISLFNPLRVFIPASILSFSLGFLHALINIIWLGRLSNTSIILIVAAIILFLFGILADQLALLRRQMWNNTEL